MVDLREEWDMERYIRRAKCAAYAAGGIYPFLKMLTLDVEMSCVTHSGRIT